jgi:hypothetical protein
MDEPTHANESRFWDLVTDWLLDGACVLSSPAQPPYEEEPARRLPGDDSPQ